MVRKVTAKDIRKLSDRRLESIMKGMTCKKNFSCVKASSRNHALTKNLPGVPLMVECLDRRKKRCQFKLPFDDVHNICTCPVRVYVTKKLSG